MASQGDVDGGYVLLYRRLLDNPVFRDHGEAMAFAWLVLNAAYKPARLRYKDREIRLQRGQLAVSVRDMAAKLGRSKDWAQRFLERLASRDMIATANATGVNIITVCNYDIYQASSRPSATVPGAQPRQDRDRTATQNKEGNEVNERIDGGFACARELGSFGLIDLTDRLARLGGVRHLDPEPIMRNHAQVREWVDAGIDIEAVIIPAIQAVLSTASAPIRSLKYFDGEVRRALALSQGGMNGTAARDPKRRTRPRDPLLDDYFPAAGGADPGMGEPLR